MDIPEKSPRDLLILKNKIKRELEDRDVVRTHNILGDYTEWRVSEEMELSLENASNAGFDATSSDGTRYQIKGRQPSSRSYWHLEIPEGSKCQFDYLIALIYNSNLTVPKAVKI